MQNAARNVQYWLILPQVNMKFQGEKNIANAEQGEKLINLPGIFNKDLAEKAILLFTSLCHSVVCLAG